MKKKKIKRYLTLLLAICLICNMSKLYVTAEPIPAVITYYVGGTNATDDGSNSGTMSDEPFATVSHATEIINAQGNGNYQIIVQDNISESKPIQIGGDDQEINVNVCNVVSGGAIIFRDASYEGDMIYVKKKATLTLGNSTDSSNTELSIDGSSDILQAYGTIILNEGTVKLYDGVTLQNNDNLYHIGGAIVNYGTFQMFGGTIRNNFTGYGGGVYNEGIFDMYNGTICDNLASSGAGVYNVYDTAVFSMTNGTITDNWTPYDGGGLVNNQGATFNMSGGTISDNTGQDNGGGVANFQSFLYMTGGSIRNNSSENGGAVYTDSTINISGDTSIPGGIDNSNDIFLDYYDDGIAHINITGSLTCSDIITVALNPYAIGTQVLTSTTSNLLVDNYIKITSKNSMFAIDKDGKLAYRYEPATYYVGGTAASDSNSGTDSNQPLATLQQAVANIGSDRRGIIIIQGDLTISQEITIKNIITITGDGNPHTISRSAGYAGRMIVVRTDGDLTLGVPSDKDTVENLIFDGKNIPVESEIIYNNSGNINMYPGVIIKNNNSNESSVLIDYRGTMNMFGGSITNNTGDYAAGLYNCGVFHMFGGNISNNTGSGSYGAGVRNSNTFNMSGGYISGNHGTYADGTGVYNSNGRFTMTGGEISNNTGRYGGGILSYAYLDISGGTIKNNEAEFGGGIFNSGDMTMSKDLTTMSEGVICYNKATQCGGGIYNSDIGTFNISAGTINHNEAIYGAGIITLRDSTLSGGIIRDNIGDWGTGIYNQFCNLTISGNVNLESEDSITNTIHNWEGTITIDGKLSDNTKIPITCGSYDIGTQLVFSGSSYTFTPEDVAKLEIVDTNYAININGKIGYALKADEVSIPDDLNLSYDGTDKTIENISVKYDKKNLVKDIDYIVSYYDNINAGSAKVIVTGIGNYAGFVTKVFTIQPAAVLSIQTKTPADQTFTASDAYSANQLIGKITLSNVDVEIQSGSKTVTLSLPITWKSTGDSYDPKGGQYTYTGTLNDSNIQKSNLKLITKITVTPEELVNPTFSNTYVTLSNNPKATATNLGEGVLPKNGVVTYKGATINYHIVWGNQTLDTTSLSSSTTFTGKITYDNLPAWVTVPKVQTVSRTVGVIDKTVVTIKGVSITSKEYDGLPVTYSGTPINNQGYTESYNYLYSGTGATKYSSTVPPTEVGSYKLTISVPSDNAGFAGSVDLPFTISSRKSTTSSTTSTTTVATVTPIVERIDLNKVKEDVLLTLNQNENSTAIHATIELPITDILDTASVNGTVDKPLTISIPIKSEKIVELLSSGKAQDTNLVVKIPDALSNNEKINPVEIVLDRKLLEAAKTVSKDMSISIVDDAGKVRYSWSFSGETLAQSNKEITNVDLAIGFEQVANNSELMNMLEDDITNNKEIQSHGFVLEFDHEGILPAQANVRIYVGDQEGITEGSKLYLYHFNHNTNKLEALPSSSGYVVDKEGYVTIDILHCSDYVLLPSEANSKVVTSLLDQINIKPSKKILYLKGSKGHTVTLKVVIPPTLEIVKTLEKSKMSSAIGAVTVNYSSSNKKVATINSKGKITAKGIGVAKIKTTLTLYNGETKTIITTVTVKNKK